MGVNQGDLAWSIRQLSWLVLRTILSIKVIHFGNKNLSFCALNSAFIPIKILQNEKCEQPYHNNLVRVENKVKHGHTPLVSVNQAKHGLVI